MPQEKIKSLSVKSLTLIGLMTAAVSYTHLGIFLCLMDKLLPHIHANSNTREGLPAKLKRTTMLVFAVTLHNAQEGMAVGVAFALAVTEGADQMCIRDRYNDNEPTVWAKSPDSRLFSISMKHS